jgi:hypothetical protein
MVPVSPVVPYPGSGSTPGEDRRHAEVYPGVVEVGDARRIKENSRRIVGLSSKRTSHPERLGPGFEDRKASCKTRPGYRDAHREKCDDSYTPSHMDPFVGV